MRCYNAVSRFVWLFGLQRCQHQYKQRQRVRRQRVQERRGATLDVENEVGGCYDCERRRRRHRSERRRWRHHSPVNCCVLKLINLVR